MKNAVLLFLASLLFVACPDSGADASYQQGQQMADQTYGAMAPAQMMKEMQAVQAKILKEVEAAKDQKAYWNGFCDKGEKIWLDRIEDINKAMGQQVLNPTSIKEMFGKMRSGFRK